MLSDILYRQEHELLSRIGREKSLVRRFFIAMKIEAVSAAYADSLAHNE